MKKQITYITALLFSVGLFTLTAEESEPTLDDRIDEVFENRTDIDWSDPSQELIDLRTDILAVHHSDLERPATASNIIQAVDSGTYLWQEGDTVSSEVEAWWREFAEEDYTRRIVLAVLHDKDLSQLPPKDAPYSRVALLNVVDRSAVFEFADIKEHVLQRGYSSSTYQNAFKQYRATLSTSAQIELTKKERDALIAVANRSRQQDVWLRELTADLMALQFGN